MRREARREANRQSDRRTNEEEEEDGVVIEKLEDEEEKGEASREHEGALSAEDSEGQLGLLWSWLSLNGASSATCFATCSATPALAGHQPFPSAAPLIPSALACTPRPVRRPLGHERAGRRGVCRRAQPQCHRPHRPRRRRGCSGAVDVETRTGVGIGPPAFSPPAYAAC